MKRVRLTIVLATALVVGSLCATPAALAQGSPSQRVTVVLAPYLTWEDLTATSTPTLWRMASEGAMGGINARSRVRESGKPPSPVEGALSISSGAWAIPDFSAASAFNADESVEGSQTAAAVYRRVFGGSMDGARIGYLGLPSAVRLNETKATGAVLGTLGQAVRDASGLTAAIGNSDIGVTGGKVESVRPAGIVAMDEVGLVSYGDISSDLLTSSPDAPYGVMTDLGRLEQAYARVDVLAKAHRGPSLLVLDPGDSYRAERFSASVTPAVAASMRRQAFRTLDAAVAMAEKRRGADGVVMVVSGALYAEADGTPQGLGPIVVSGQGWRGYLTSSSTHRTGVVTTLDVTASVLDIMGIARPVQVLGDPMVAVLGPAAVGQRVEHLTRMSDAAVAIDGSKPVVIPTFIGLIVFVMGFSAVVMARGNLWRYQTQHAAVRLLEALLLLLLSVPLSCWLMFAVTPRPGYPGVAVASLLGTTFVVWAVSLAASRFWPVRLPVAVLCLLTVAVLVVDQLAGAPLSFVGYLGYSPLLAARFYGMGNEAAAILFGSAIVGVALLLDHLGRSRWGMLGRRYGIAALGLVVVGIAAAPFWGANVGVAVWGLVGFVLAWMLMNGKRIDWRFALGAAALVVVVVVGLSAVDLWGGGPQTHLGRSLSSAEQGGVSQLSAIVVRKAQTNARVFTHTDWSWVLVAALAFIGFVRFRPSTAYEDAMADSPCFASAIVVTLAGGVLAFFTEDSGIVIPAIIMLYTGVGLSWLMASRLIAEKKEPLS